jgi:hypothetical protein
MEETLFCWIWQIKSIYTKKKNQCYQSYFMMSYSLLLSITSAAQSFRKLWGHNDRVSVSDTSHRIFGFLSYYNIMLIYQQFKFISCNLDSQICWVYIISNPRSGAIQRNLSPTLSQGRDRQLYPKGCRLHWEHPADRWIMVSARNESKYSVLLQLFH